MNSNITKEKSHCNTHSKASSVFRVFESSELVQIQSCYGDIAPEGEFCEGRHGFTHFVFHQPTPEALFKNNDTWGNLIIMAHGLGTSLQAYKDLISNPF